MRGFKKGYRVTKRDFTLAGTSNSTAVPIGKSNAVVNVPLPPPPPYFDRNMPNKRTEGDKIVSVSGMKQKVQGGGDSTSWSIYDHLPPVPEPVKKVVDTAVQQYIAGKQKAYADTMQRALDTFGAMAVAQAINAARGAPQMFLTFADRILSLWLGRFIGNHGGGMRMHP